MIFVSRVQETEAGDPVLPRESWFTASANKTQDAIDDGPSHEVTSLYKDDRVRAALEELFSEKCAYCESPVGAANGMDVEHYRPKGSVHERDDHPGYYWLAYEWENLYLSCQLCNQRRKDNPTFDDSTTGAAAGKLDQFPIVDEATRAMTPDESIEDEVPLLLDPNVDNPELHLTFDPLTGEALAIDDDEFGVASIEICHLNRRRLVKARLRRIDEVRDSIAQFRQLMPAASEDDLLDAALTVFGADDAPYAGCVRAVLGQETFLL